MFRAGFCFVRPLGCPSRGPVVALRLTSPKIRISSNIAEYDMLVDREFTFFDLLTDRGCYYADAWEG